jgi:thiol:disulfide interchange protein DsbC
MWKKVMWRKALLALFASGVALGVHAAGTNGTAGGNGDDGHAMQVVRLAMSRLAPHVEIDSVRQSPLPGFYQVIASGRLVYISVDGRYMLNGDLVDLGSKVNLSDNAWADFRKAELAKVPQAQRIVYAPAHPKYTVTVFTDVNCGYCRALHEQVAAFNKDGIAVEYLAWPREGVTTTAGNLTPTYKEMVSVWCASDRKAAFDAAKDGRAPHPATCTNPVKEQFELGLRLGVDGTPTIIGPDGTVLGGYVPADKLLKMLQEGGSS